LRTLNDAELRVIAGGVQVTSTSAANKDDWPNPPRSSPLTRPPRLCGRQWLRKGGRPAAVSLPCTWSMPWKACARLARTGRPRRRQHTPLPGRRGRETW